MKKCTKCNIEKSADMFSKHKNTKDGLQYSCKECCKIYKKQWDLDNKEHTLEYDKQWRLDNPEYKKQYYLDNKSNIVYLYYFNNKLLYVGSTENPLKRHSFHKNSYTLQFHRYLKEHHLDIDDCKKISHVFDLEMSEVRIIEKQFINELNPICNINF